MNKTVVIIPTYNEVENLPIIIERTLRAGTGIDILVVDDNSPDGTGDLADQIANTTERVRVLHRAGKAGLGAAYLNGFAEALALGYDKFFEMDADGSHPPERLPAMIELLDDYAIVIGSRWMPGGSTVNWPRRRRLLSQGGNLYTRALLRIPVRDATGGFRGFTREALSHIDLGAVASQGYCFQVDLLWRGIQAGLRFIEVPITFTERVSGYSKMSGAIVGEALAQVTGWGLRYNLRQVRRLFLRD